MRYTTKSSTIVLCNVVALLIGDCFGQCTNNKDFVTCAHFEDIDTIIKGQFQHMRQLKVNGQKSPFPCVSASPFDAFPNLSDLVLDHCYFLLIQAPCFRDMTRIQSVSLNGNKLVEVDLGTFNGSDIKAIYLNNNFILKVNLVGVVLPALVQLELYGNLLETIHLDSTNLPKVNNIYLGYNRITQFHIENGNARSVDLQRNRIKSFRAEDLVLPNANLLYLNNNELRAFTGNMLKSVPKITTLFLAHNQLHHIDLPLNNVITSLDVRHNRIRSLDDVTFVNLKRKNSIDFSSNKIYELAAQDLPNDYIDGFTCFYCNIHVIEADFLAKFMRNLTHVTLSFNYITTLNIFRSALQPLRLQTVNLGYNLIEAIKANDLIMAPDVETLSLDFNRIRTVEDHAFDGLKKLYRLDLSHNCILQLPDNVFDHNAVLDQLILDFNLMTYFPIPQWNGVDNAVIKSAKDHRLFKLSSLYVRSMPWQCSCYEMLIDWMRANFLKFDLLQPEPSDGKRPVCISTDRNCSKDFDVMDLKSVIGHFRPSKFPGHTYGQCDL